MKKIIIALLALAIVLSTALIPSLAEQAGDATGGDLTDGVETSHAADLLNTSDIPVNTDPTGDEIGFSSARIEHYDTTAIVDIKNYEQAPYEDFYKITDVDGFAMLDAQLYNYSTFSDVTIFLANDIDFSGVEGFKPISYDVEYVKHVNGTPRFYFSGILDGQGEAICNLRVHSTEKATTFTAEERTIRVDGAF